MTDWYCHSLVLPTCQKGRASPAHQPKLALLTARALAACSRFVFEQDNQLTGGLPEEWGSYELEGLPALRVLNLSNNPLGGTLPYQWSQQQAFPSLKTL